MGRRKPFWMPQTQAELSKDAIDRRYVPGSIVISLDSGEIQITSYPWFRDSGFNRTALVMARTIPGDPTTNGEHRYFAIMRLVREGSL
jgi:hypothetical protein